jgi:hypothetical protein
VARSKGKADKLAADYSRIRKPMAPPEKVETDRRPGLLEDQAEQDIQDSYQDLEEEQMAPDPETSDSDQESNGGHGG